MSPWRSTRATATVSIRNNTMAEGAGGYNIPISVSAADTFSVPTTLTSPTYFVFGSTGARVGGDIAADADSYAPATAVSSLAQDQGVSSASATPPAAPAGFFGDGVDTKKVLLWGAIAIVGAGLVIGAIVYFHRKG